MADVSHSVPGPVAQLSTSYVDPPGLESETPDPAATGSGAITAHRGGGHTASVRQRQLQRYEATLDAIRPGCSASGKRMRCGILYLRDRATAALVVSGWEASLLLRAIESLAAVHAFAPMPIEQLTELHHAMVRILVSALALDQRGPREDI